MNAERIRAADLIPQPWRNGAGQTRELAMSPPGASFDDFDWRLSLAEVTREAPFSAFPDVDRCIVLLRGRGLLLHAPNDAAPARLEQAMLPFFFRGEDAFQAHLIDGASTDLSIMVRRGRWEAQVRPCEDLIAIDAADAALVLCCAGVVQATAAAGSSHRLQEMEALLWRNGSPAMRVGAVSRGAAAIVVQLRSRQQPGTA